MSLAQAILQNALASPEGILDKEQAEAFIQDLYTCLFNPPVCSVPSGASVVAGSATGKTMSTKVSVTTATPASASSPDQASAAALAWHKKDAATNPVLATYQIRLQQLELRLVGLLAQVVHDYDLAKQEAAKFFAALEEVFAICLADSQYFVQRDPAAHSVREVQLAYPGFFAIAVYRLAHQLYKQSIDVIPRLWTEYAHARTGVDIHPGATIGRCFCIDHGTGVVIGETSIIGHHVHLYQGVTIGALSVHKSAAGKKRHPTIGNHVVIYANACVLGGNTVVGDNCIIGGNVWLTTSLEPDTTVISQSEPLTKNRKAAQQAIFYDI